MPQFRFVPLGLAFASALTAGVICYEGDTGPIGEGWTPNTVCNPVTFLDAGSYHQHVDLCDGFPPPGGQRESFTRDISEFVGTEKFFLEWRVQTTGDASEIPGTAPSSMVAGGAGGDRKSVV